MEGQDILQKSWPVYFKNVKVMRKHDQETGTV